MFVRWQLFSAILLVNRTFALPPSSLEVLELLHTLNKEPLGEAPLLGQPVEAGLEQDAPASSSLLRSSLRGAAGQEEDSLVVTDAAETTCPDVVFVKGGEAFHRVRMGAYKRVDVTQKNETGRPVYENTLFKQFLYFYPDTQSWLIGPDYNGSAAGVISVGEAWCPSDQKDWKVFAGGAYQNSQVTVTGVSKNTCPEYMFVTGAELVQGESMGTFWRRGDDSLGEKHGWRPVYENAKGRYIYYNAKMLQWVIDNATDATNAGLLSFGEANSVQTWCPFEALGWIVFDPKPGKFVGDYRIILLEPTPSSCPSEHYVATLDVVAQDCLGSYKLTEPPAELARTGTGGRPVYVNDKGQYLYYWLPNASWQFATATDGGIDCAVSSEGLDFLCPNLVLFWDVQEHKQGFTGTIVVSDVSTDECAESYAVAGAADSQPMCMGVFEKIEDITQEQAGRPVYKNEHDEYLYYYASMGAWNIGSDYKEETAGVAGVVALSKADCPSSVQSWGVYKDGQFALSDRVACEAMSDAFCADSLLLTGGESAQAVRMGLFFKAPIQPSLQQAGRPIFVNQRQQFLYYWMHDQEWKVGPNIHSAVAGVTTVGKLRAVCPAKATSWLVWDADRFHSDYKVMISEVSNEVCADVVYVTGAEQAQSSRMGTFRKLEPEMATIQQAGRPLYVSDAGEYLYYWGVTAGWKIGPDFTQAAAGVMSTGTHANCPTEDKDWLVYVGGSFQSGFPVVVTEARSPVKCADSLLLQSDYPGVQSTRMGRFSKMLLQEEIPDHAGRPLYVNDNKEYLFYWAGLTGWQIGPDYRSPAAGIRSADGFNRWCPEEVIVWRAYAGGKWSDKFNIDEMVLGDPDCADRVYAYAPAANVDEASLGVFWQNGSWPREPTHEGHLHPMYVNSAGHHMFMKDKGLWAIAESLEQEVVDVVSTGREEECCPEKEKAWAAWSEETHLFDKTRPVTVDVVSINPCADGYVIAGGEEAQPGRMGVFRKNVTHRLATEQAGRPVFSNNFGEFLYYWSPDGDWKVGPRTDQPGSGVVSSKGKHSACPDEASGWMVFKGDRFTDELKIVVLQVKKERCSDVFEISGAEDVQGTRMGTFRKSPCNQPADTGSLKDDDRFQAGRPCYLNEKRQFLYYWSTTKTWQIGQKCFEGKAGVVMASQTDDACPPEDASWMVHVQKENRFKVDDRLAVKATGGIPPPPTTTTTTATTTTVTTTTSTTSVTTTSTTTTTTETTTAEASVAGGAETETPWFRVVDVIVGLVLIVVLALGAMYIQGWRGRQLTRTERERSATSGTELASRRTDHTRTHMTTEQLEAATRSFVTESCVTLEQTRGTFLQTPGQSALQLPSPTASGGAGGSFVTSPMSAGRSSMTPAQGGTFMLSPRPSHWGALHEDAEHE
eukprot:TRINITY_DN63354_c0_g3_i1.p1 TRINITY_DN63354_c0_g3~~TRINITY_DN63354_c0_g3_i1.p1  ORF type:complete len:1396 (+),score=250.64 TRINITY_DN63354_c0_g3_i1:111-4298(+)